MPIVSGFVVLEEYFLSGSVDIVRSQVIQNFCFQIKAGSARRLSLASVLGHIFFNFILCESKHGAGVGLPSQCNVITANNCVGVVARQQHPRLTMKYRGWVIDPVHST